MPVSKTPFCVLVTLYVLTKKVVYMLFARHSLAAPLHRIADQICDVTSHFLF